MAQTGYTPILIYGSTTPGNAPSAANLTTSANGVELAINATDGKLFYKDNAGNVQVIAGNGITIPQVISVNSTSDALRITQTGAGNALVVEDAANPDSTPFVIDKDGYIISGATTTASIGASAVNPPRISIYGTSGGNGSDIALINTSSSGTIAGDIRHAKAPSGGIVANNNQLGNSRYFGFDGATYIEAASISAQVDGTPGTNDMPGRLVFSTTADGASAPIERMRIGSSGTVGFGVTNAVNYTIRTGKDITGGTTAGNFYASGQTQPDVTSTSYGYLSQSSTAASAFTLIAQYGFRAIQGAFGAGSTVTNQYGFGADDSLIGATNNYGFYSNIPSGTGRWNFYANGTASNYFGGNTIVQVTDNTNAALRITQLGTGNALVVEDSSNPDATPFVIDSSGKTIVGYTTALGSRISAATITPALQTVATTYSNASIGQWGYNTAAYHVFSRSASATIGTNSPISSNDVIGAIEFTGDDGTNFTSAARIFAAVDGTPGTDDMPGRLVFSTTADGASAPTERMRIDSAGNVNIATAGARITGDFSNATTSNRVGFQTNVVNGSTYVIALPNGTGNSALQQMFNGSDVSNAGRMQVGITSTEAVVESTKNGTGTYLPMTFSTGGVEAVRIDTNQRLIAQKAANGIISALTDGVTITPDFNAANNFSVTLAGNRTLANPTNLVAGQSGVIFITQDATGSRTLAYGSSWDFPNQVAPTLTTTANAVDMLVFTVRSSTSIGAVLINNIG